MVHPCRTGNPGTVLHACSSLSATKTLCGLSINQSEINATAGFKSVCSVCFPSEMPKPDETGQPIQGR